MRQKKYLYDFSIQVLLIIVVFSLFRVTPDKIQASFWAGALFVLMPVSMMSRQWIFYRWENRLWWGAVLQFWILFALPLFALRCLYPRTTLSEVTLGPVPVSLLHELSSVSYFILMAVTLWSAWKTREVQNKKP